MKIKTFLSLCILLLLLSCKQEEEHMLANDPPNVPTEEDFEVKTIIPNGDEAYLNLDSDYLFDQEKLPTFELKIPATALAKLNGDPAAEEYVEGMLIFEGDTISPVGVRYKGSIGAFVGCLSGTDWINPSGYKTCTKLSMKIKINWEGRTEKFFQQKKIQLHSQNNDDSQMRERLGYHLFRAMGVAAPRSIHAKLIINGQYSGLYALTEQIDGRFVKHNFEDDEGNLYKEIWPLQMNGQAQSEQSYLNALKTNEDENPSVAIIKNFAQSLADADAATLPTVIEEYMNITEVLSYAVVDRMIRHDDGPFHWYCNAGVCTNHNYFWYEAPNNQQLHLIPWDLDNAFENIISNANPVTPIANAWGTSSANCQPFAYGGFGLQQWSAACDKLTGGWASYTTEYEQLKTQLINGAFSEAQVNSLLETWSNQIRAATRDAYELHGDAISVPAWEQALATLKSQVDFARNN